MLEGVSSPEAAGRGRLGASQPGGVGGLVGASGRTLTWEKTPQGRKAGGELLPPRAGAGAEFFVTFILAEPGDLPFCSQTSGSGAAPGFRGCRQTGL